MKLRTLAVIALAGMVWAGSSQGAEGITEFRIGILGGENASDRLRSNECLREKTEAILGVPTKLFAPADYNGVIEGLLGGNLDMAWLGASGYSKVYLTNPDALSRFSPRSTTTGRLAITQSVSPGKTPELPASKT
jgi:phosphonate transport system substrate-binding protein